VVRNVTQIRWEIIPQNRSRTMIRSICYFKTRGERRATKSDKRRRLRAEVRRLTNLKDLYV